MLTATYFFRLSFFKLSFMPMVVSPIVMPTGFVSFVGGGVVLETVVSAPASLSLLFPQLANKVAIAITNIILFMTDFLRSYCGIKSPAILDGYCWVTGDVASNCFPNGCS